MTKWSTSDAVQAVANVAVIAGIAFLAVELRQNNELIETQIRTEFFTWATSFPEEIIRTPELATALVKLEGGEELTPSEDMVIRAFALRTFRQFEWQYQEFDRGRLDALDLQLWRAGFRGEGIFRWPLGVYWNDMRPFMRTDFVEFIEGNVLN